MRSERATGNEMTTDTAQKKNYKETLNLPQTGFPMEAKLVQSEPKRLEKWQAMGLYRQLMEARATADKWILHDGPPFANGDIHIGQTLNKTLKDVFLRFRSMRGYQTPYVPGWDCHGLPIEHKIQQDLGPKLREMGVLDVRKRCFAYADKYVHLQSRQFQRLGILGEWDDPYLTMSPDYEARTLEVFANIVEKGLVYKQLKPVPWSVANQTALADAELEYMEVEHTSIYVEFPAKLQEAAFQHFGLRRLPVYFLVWTTTPWTLPANLAIALNPDIQYLFVPYTKDGEERLGVIASGVPAERRFGFDYLTSQGIMAVASGKNLVDANLRYRHPFIDREGRLVAAEYVTTTDGTGLVHIAPGHGEEDYETGIREGLDVYSPVLANGRYDDSVPEWLRGKTVWEANSLIVTRLADLGLLLAAEKIAHTYPHDWRSKTPIIFRATEQWFIAVRKPFDLPNDSAASEEWRKFKGEAGTLVGRALRALWHDIAFIPDWGKARMAGMLESRPDWCISRQRAWGLPIPIFYNEQGEALLTPESVRAVSKRFGEKGSDAWFTDSPAELLGPHFRYPPGFAPDKLRKEKDIFDVWFESGSSWHAVLQARPSLRFPADMYLEGSDQHRGWFQLSLLPSLGAIGVPPFKQVLTHGFVVKPDGTKVSKSDKEYVSATQEIERHGADLLRLWCCSVDYQNDIPTSPQVIKEFGDKYRKIRNTLRFLLANLYHFDPATDSREVPLNSLDGWAWAELDTLIGDVTASYEGYQLHRAFRLLHDFCAVQISAIYANAMKDRLYCELPDAPLRRRCQTVLHRMIVALTKLLAPMIVFTADEAWEQITHKPEGEQDLPSVHLALLPKPSGIQVSQEQRAEWQRLLELRSEALLQLDALKKEAGLNKALDAEVIYHVNDKATHRRLEAYGVDLEDLVGAGSHSFAEMGPTGSGIPFDKLRAGTVKVADRRDVYKTCARSWKRRPDVGQDQEYPDLCRRCAAAVRALAK